VFDRTRRRRQSTKASGPSDHLLLSRPFVLVPMGEGAELLELRSRKCSPCSARFPDELTGRGRYRAWGII
jgi:hypothetical protein